MGNIIICGAPRAGTTSLYRYLASHPDITASNTKELNYFLGGTHEVDTFNESSISLKNYMNNFQHPDRYKWTLEASPAYMHPGYLPQVAYRISKMNPNSRILFILRDPIDRLYSQFQGRKERAGQLGNDFLFSDFVQMLIKDDSPSHHGIDLQSEHIVKEGLMIGAYINTIQHYLKYFPDTQLKILFTDSLSKQPGIIMTELCQWLNLSSGFYNNYTFNVENKMVHSNNQMIYRTALSLNKILEPILNRMPYIRNILRNAHHAVNTSSKVQKNQIDENTIEVLKNFYLPYNNELINLMKHHWTHINFPTWLNNSDDYI